MKYEKLFQKGYIGKVEIRNRVVMTSMGVGLCSRDGEPTEELIRYYEDRAKGGCGLILPEFTSVDIETGHCNPRQLCIGDRKNLPGFERMIDAVHRYGAKMFIQLHHGGREAPPAVNGGKQALAPSALLNSVANRDVIQPREMTKEDIDYIVDKFVNAALNAERVGADGVELHAGHGYLLQQFLSPYTNHRTDEYGGSMENRCRIVVDILKGIRAVVGRNFVVGARINGDDFIEGGNDLNACVEIAKHLEPYVDYLNISSGVYASAAKMIEPCYYAAGWRKNLAKTIKANVNVPVIAVNTIKDPQTAEAFLQEGVSDFVGISRGHIADPEFVNKTKAGREDLIRKCLGCMNCNKSVVADRQLQCAVNPVTGKATILGEEKLNKNGEGRSVAVLGGGPSGMQAALVLKKRGFAPVIFEKSGELGGSAILASKAPMKHMVTEFINTQKAEMKEYGIDVRLNTPYNLETVQALNPYGVVVAIGGEQIVPNIPGANNSNVYNIYDVLLGGVKFQGKKIAVIGGGHVGLEVAHFLCSDNQVTLVEMQPEVGMSIYRTYRNELQSILENEGVNIIVNHAIAGVTDTDISMKNMLTGEIEHEPVDAVIMALGNYSKIPFRDELEAAFDRVVYVGDTVKTGTIADATTSGYNAAFTF